MKLPWDKKYKIWGVVAFLAIAASITFYMLFDKWESVSYAISLAVKSLAPITYGLILAYLLNPLMNVIEQSMVYPVLKKLFKSDSKRIKGVSRGISIFITWIVATVFIVALLALIIPELYSSIETLVDTIPEYSENIIRKTSALLKENPEILGYINELLNGFSTDLSSILNKVQELLPNINSIVTSLTSSVSAVVSAIFNLLVGVIVSIYVLKDKERNVAQFKKVFYSVMPLKNANNTIAFWRLTHDKFGNFITGKIFDSLIIGLLCFIILTLVNMPYAALVSAIVGVTNVIPFFGPFIGAIPSAFLILLVDPLKCITFVVIVIILQQFDGNILGPKILGSTTGISSFWVMFSILVGSGLFGVWGMICAVPLFAVIYTLLKDFCHQSLRKKGIDYSSETYERIDHIDENTNSPKWL